ncbi:MAG: DedA family protein [Chlamydiae bacterium]|nr:MAG: DedA family protein [Chlamydiota bacterium]
MTDILVGHIEQIAAHAHLWGFLIVFVLMTIESSFIPFPSEVVMVPAGFLAFRGELLFGNPMLDLVTVVLCGVLGSIFGAYINYFLSLKLGRPILHRYGKYVLLKQETVERAEEIFNKYGDLTTFVCRLLPAIRQLISIPAGLSKMPLGKFTLYTTLGATVWTSLLAGTGYYLATLASDMTYKELVYKGKDFLHGNYLWILLFIAVIIIIYILTHKTIMKKSNVLSPEVTE